MATETLSFSTPSTFPSTASGEYNKGGYGNNNATWYYSSGWYRLIFLRQFTPTKALSSLTVTLDAGKVSSQRYGAGYNRLNHFRCAIYPATTAFDPWPSADSSGSGKEIDTWTYGGSAATSGDISFSTDSAGNAFAAGTKYYLYVWYYKEQSTYYASSGNITVTGTGTVKTYTVSYNANGGSGAPDSQTKTYGTALTLSSTKPTRTGYTFQHWNTKSDGSGTSYAAGANYTANAAATLYAKWKATTATDPVTLPTATRSGYKFLGWAKTAGATAAQYTAGDSYAATGNVTLYAVWQAQGLAEIAEGSNFGEYQIYIANGSGWDPYQAYAANGSGWDPYV